MFNSVKEINRLRKELNRLLGKGMWNIYLKVTIEKTWQSQNFDFLHLKNLSPSIIEFYIWLNFKTCCNLKIKGLRANLCVAFLLFWFWKKLWSFKVKESIHFVEQKHKMEWNWKWKIPHIVLERRTLWFSLVN